MLKTMEGLQLCVLVFLIATVTASPRNVVEYEMENVSERDEARADNRWLEKVNIYFINDSRFVKGTLANCADPDQTL